MTLLCGYEGGRVTDGVWIAVCVCEALDTLMSLHVCVEFCWSEVTVVLEELDGGGGFIIVTHIETFGPDV